ncbi:phage virion morphogenesis protein [Candidatus Symbiopectobacterium sp. 'North America']|uniref:phage virion morphogenesis protein n=1 Tax=Candidatus Symbiopectobacterium sp. 'North America' TaxID=2794574 RepID=UPI0018C98FAF|nr:phage virion morphogenesis protein [Candidatus Symbiopectobacterium sp. 'North America']MBG6245591.1 phage virion morphogenesis protein [Candidatus Symbiopectobacterium sp. 'North America']
MNELKPFDDELAGLLAKMSPASRKALARDIANDLRKTNQARIRKQKSPDGMAFTQRKAQVITVQRGMKILWNDEVRSLKNWRKRKARFGTLFTGYDTDRKAIRSFYISDIQRFIEVKKERVNTRSGKAKALIFQQLVKNKYMLAVASPNDATITFANKARRVAEIHHYGQTDKQRGHNKEIQYPERQLLGITRSDKERVSDLVIQHLSK